MTLHLFTKNLVANGYSQAKHPCLYHHYFVSGSRALIVDNVRGGAYRLFMGVNCVPACHPPAAAISQRQIDAESPWFRYRGTEKKSEALDQAWHWLQTVGFPFLADPFSRELHRWITDENILIRDKGGIIPIPHVMRLP
jgi:hypothetical protein